MSSKNNNGSKVVRILYWTIMPIVSAASLAFSVGSRISSPKNNPGKDNPGIEKRVWTLELKDARWDERWNQIQTELRKINDKLDELQH